MSARYGSGGYSPMFGPAELDEIFGPDVSPWSAGAPYVAGRGAWPVFSPSAMRDIPAGWQVSAVPELPTGRATPRLGPVPPRLRRSACRRWPAPGPGADRGRPCRAGAELDDEQLIAVLREALHEVDPPPADVVERIKQRVFVGPAPEAPGRHAAPRRRRRFWIW